MSRPALLLAILGGVAALVALAPIAVGLEAARAYDRFVARADGAVRGLQVEGALERGLWHSTARTTIRLEEGGRTRTFVLDHWISHGPVPLAEVIRGRSPFVLAAAVAETRYGADPRALPRIAAALDGAPLVRVVAWLGLDEAIRLEATSPPFRLGEGEFHTAGTRASLVLGPHGRGLEGRVVLGAIGAREGDATLRLGGARVAFGGGRGGTEARPEEALTIDLELDPSSLTGAGGAVEVGSGRAHLATGPGGPSDATRDLSLEIESLRLRGPDPAAPPVRITGVALEQSGRPDPETGLHSSRTEIRFARLESASGAHGPGVAVVAMRRIDAAAFRDVRATLASAPTRADPGAGPAVPAPGGLVAGALARLLRARPELEVESLSVQTAEGEITGRGRLGVTGELGAPGAEPSGGAAWLRGASAVADLSVPARLLEAALDAHLVEQVREEMGEATEAERAMAAAFVRDAVLARLTAQGLIVLEGGRYRVELRVQDGVTIVNGRAFDPASLGGASALP